MSDHGSTGSELVTRPGTGQSGHFDLENPGFPSALRGYDRAAVDAYVEAVGRELRELRIAPENEQTAVRRTLDRIGSETAAILQQAHDAAEAIRRRAIEDTAETLEAARRRATQMIQDAETHLQDLDADTDVVWQERLRIIEDTRSLAQELLEAADAATQRFPNEERTPEGGYPALKDRDADVTQAMPPQPPPA